MKSMFRLFMAFTLVTTLLVLTKCGDDAATGTLSTVHDASYVGQGSFWSWDLNADGTFTATQKANASAATNDLEINGTYVTHSTGFYTFTVTSATGTNAPSAGDQAQGFGVPGVMLIVKPIGGDDPEPLVMPAVGACPSAQLSLNWIQAKTEDGGDNNQKDEGFWGNATIDVPGDITGYSFDIEGDVSAEQTFTTTTGCTDGVIAFSDPEGDGYITITTAGVGLIQTGSDNAIVAIPRDTTVDASSLNSKEFVALLFFEENGGTIQPMNLTVDANGSGTYTFITDVQTGATGETGTLNIDSAGTGQMAGFVKVIVNTDNSDVPTMWAGVIPNVNSSGRAAFIATGLSAPDYEDTFSIIAIEK